MKAFKRVVSAGVGALALAFSSSSFAGFVNIGGLDVPLGAHFETTQVYEKVVTGNGQELRGVGKVDTIQGIATGSLCVAGVNTCELTFEFGGLISQNFAGSSLEFSGGWVNFYLDTHLTAAGTFNPFFSSGSAADRAAATNGTLFLTLAGHKTVGTTAPFLGDIATLFSTGTLFGTGSDAGTGSGLFDVDTTGLLNGNTAGAGAIANSNFDTNSLSANLGGKADFLLTSSFSSAVVPHPSECTGTPPAGAECLAGTTNLRGLVIPEPGTLSLLGLSMLGLAAGVRRRNAK